MSDPQRLALIVLCVVLGIVLYRRIAARFGWRHQHAWTRWEKPVGRLHDHYSGYPYQDRSCRECGLVERRLL